MVSGGCILDWLKIHPDSLSYTPLHGRPISGPLFLSLRLLPGLGKCLTLSSILLGLCLCLAVVVADCFPFQVQGKASQQGAIAPLRLNKSLHVDSKNRPWGIYFLSAE